jgi:glycosyltransferase involved in cell wall biosynthesis
MLISFTLPTRKRIPQLTKALESIYSTCYSKDNFEILLAIDNDDLETIEFAKNFITNHHNTKMFLFERQRYKGMHVYQNTLIEHASGEFIWTINDDAEFQSQDWDLIIQEYSSQFIIINPLTPSLHHYVRNESIPGYCWVTFPIVPKKWIDITGRLSSNAASDSWVSEVVYQAKVPYSNEDRIILEHYRFDETGCNEDETYHQRTEDVSIVRSDFNDQYQIDERVKDIELIKSYLEKENPLYN